MSDNVEKVDPKDATEEVAGADGTSEGNAPTLYRAEVPIEFSVSHPEWRKALFGEDEQQLKDLLEQFPECDIWLNETSSSGEASISMSARDRQSFARCLNAVSEVVARSMPMQGLLEKVAHQRSKKRSNNVHFGETEVHEVPSKYETAILATVACSPDLCNDGGGRILSAQRAECARLSAFDPPRVLPMRLALDGSSTDSVAGSAVVVGANFKGSVKELVLRMHRSRAAAVIFLGALSVPSLQKEFVPIPVMEILGEDAGWLLLKLRSGASLHVFVERLARLGPQASGQSCAHDDDSAFFDDW